jgi:hypothetical protein
MGTLEIERCGWRLALQRYTAMKECDDICRGQDIEKESVEEEVPKLL